MKYIIGRQPILDRNEQLLGYELLFRPSRPLSTENLDNSYATANVIINSLSGFGLQEILGGHKGFINIEHELLMDDVLEILPKQMVVLELLESIQLSDAMVERCRLLKERGFTLALDDHVYHPSYDPLYRMVDIVKLDLVENNLDEVAQMVENLRPYPMKLVAEKVETREQFEACSDLGFDYFQGYYFSKPLVIEKKKIDDSGASLLKLLHLLMDDAGIEEIVNAFQASPGLTYKLLMLVNSVAVGSRVDITSVRHAITMLGLQQIKRWVQICLFATSTQSTGDNPMMDMAAVRAGFMEALARHHGKLRGIPTAPEQAFMVGILSLMEAIYSVPMQEVVTTLNLSGELSSALLTREGPFGELLQFAEDMERLLLGYDTLENRLKQMDITHDQMLQARFDSFMWKSAGKSAA
ncbi:EAL and HDOD domain-containing protein [Geomesophilobacter sediminis]|uniref:EAL domain-containing protein n=1 Tax=Geomesophilobacter sediminis TaxID=2798584 RepID=A0A8J7ILF7_9BACT|nr:EAL domain-containing protein [Geomesophilobacter sediminis]MBJ6723498.1 EAL domain-containing protein [Geomesophilobacter sediminis]